ncbi:hypothetical protein ACFYTC_46235 [Actinomadura nitritigenes]
MIPQGKKSLGPTIVTVVLLVFAVKNPEKAAGLVNAIFEAIDRFSSALGT